MTQNHDRLPKEVIAVREAGETIEKMGFLSAHEEYEFMIRVLKKMKPDEQSRTAIIVRTHLQGQRIYDSIAKAEIPCAQVNQYKKKEAGNLFLYETVAGYIKFSLDLRRGSARRKDLYLIMNRPERYLPRAIAHGETVTKMEMQESVKGRSASENALSGLIKCCDILSAMKPVHAVKYLRKIIDTKGWIQTKGISAEEAALFFDELQHAAMSMQSQQELLSWLWSKIIGQYDQGAKGPVVHGKSKMQNQTGGVHILTMHASKGLEFDNVFLPDLNEGIFPSRQADTPAMIEEERRLFYVAITRARNRLWLMYVAGTDQSPVPISRFLVSLH